MAFSEVGIELEFRGEGEEEKALVKSCNDERFQLEKGKEILSIDPRYFRPAEVDLLVGDASKAHKKLGWKPEYDLKELIKEMMESDLMLMQKEQHLKNGGYTTLNYFE